MQHATRVDSFTEWARDAEPSVRRLLTASYGPQVGKDAAADAFVVAWERWPEISAMASPVGYVYGIGRNKARQIVGRVQRHRRQSFVDVPQDTLPRVEPALPAALAALPELQRIVVVMLHGYGYTMTEVATLLGTKKTTVQNHAERGMTKLRSALGAKR